VAPTAEIATTPVAAAGAAAAARVTASSRPPISQSPPSSAAQGRAGAGGYGLGNILELVLPAGSEVDQAGDTTARAGQSNGPFGMPGSRRGRSSYGSEPVAGDSRRRGTRKLRARPRRTRGRATHTRRSVAGTASSGNESWLELETDEGASGMSSWGEITAEDVEN
jgi:hypothetical protein